MTNKFDTLHTAMVEAMKTGDTFRRDAIRSVIGAARRYALDNKCETTDEVVDNTLLKEIKIIKEQLRTCPAGYEKLVEEYNTKLKVLEEFAPKLITDPKEIEKLIRQVVITNTVATTNTGFLMKTVMPLLKGKCDLSVASQVLRTMQF